MIVFRNVRYYNGPGFSRPGSVWIRGSRIDRVSEDPDPKLPEGSEAVDGQGGYLIPGYIDLHAHGGRGCKFGDGDMEGTKTVLRCLASHGTTSCLAGPTVQPAEEIQRAIAVAVECGGQHVGANVLGVHLEGPFLNLERIGSNNTRCLQVPTVENYRRVAGDYADLIRRVTLAPELDEEFALTRYLSEQGVCVSAGHTAAPGDVFRRSIDAGVRMCTHFFNGMNPFHHRDPGVVGTGLLDDRVSAEMICDLVHLHPDAIRLVHRVKGPGRCVVSTDTTRYAAMPDGVYGGDGGLTIRDGVCRTAGGVLAGSVVPMHVQVQRLLREVGLGLSDVVRMTSVNAAALIGVSQSKGAVREGWDADLNLLDQNWELKKTMIMGKIFSPENQDFI